MNIPLRSDPNKLIKTALLRVIFVLRNKTYNKRKIMIVFLVGTFDDRLGLIGRDWSI